MSNSVETSVGIRTFDKFVQNLIGSTAYSSLSGSRFKISAIFRPKIVSYLLNLGLRFLHSHKFGDLIF